MLNFVLKRIVGTQNERALRKLQPLVDSINNLEPEISKMSDADLRAKTDEFRQRVGDEEKKNVSQLRELKEQVSEATSPEEKDKLKKAGMEFVKLSPEEGEKWRRLAVEERMRSIEASGRIPPETIEKIKKMIWP